MVLYIGDFISLIGIISISLVMIIKLISLALNFEFKLFGLFIRVALGVFCLGGFLLFLGRAFGVNAY